MYRVEFTSSALKDLKKLDPHITLLIVAWISKNLDQCDNPRLYGKGLSSDKKGIWRYRIGDYRLLCQIFDERLIILVVDVGHRKEIYK
jgi:mRNA interferase RelE/StbE